MRTGTRVEHAVSGDTGEIAGVREDVVFGRNYRVKWDAHYEAPEHCAWYPKGELRVIS